MGHLNFKGETYRVLRERLDRNPIGLPEDIHIYDILAILFSEEEARLAAAFPLHPASFAEIREMTGMGEQRLRDLLDAMMGKGLVLEQFRAGKVFYILSMAVAGFFEFTFMRYNQTLPLKELAKLMREYRLAEHFPREFFKPGTPRARSLMHDSAFVRTETMTFEQCEYLVKEAGRGSLGTCYCRHESHHLGKECRFPYDDVCISLGSASDFLVAHQFARRAEVPEILDKLKDARDRGLVFLCDNVQGNITFVCSCCGCCCMFLCGYTQKNLKHAVATTNYLPLVDAGRCPAPACMECVRRCQIGAVEADPGGGVRIDAEKCLGCGICSMFCRQKAIEMKPREKKLIPPASMRELFHRLLQERQRL